MRDKDNGGPSDHANNFPFRGAKGSDFEGGVRAVAFVSGGFLPARQMGTHVKGMLHITDLYATLAGLAGVSDVTDHKCVTSRLGATCPQVDSLDMWPMLSGANATSPRTELVLSGGTGTGNGFIGEGGRYKLIRGVPELVSTSR